MQPPKSEQLIRWASTASLFVALMLIGLKVAAWTTSGSVSLFASLIDSLLDAAASLINFIAIRYALKPADEDHRFGHGKAEALAGLAQASFILSSSVFLLLQIIDRFINPENLKDISTGTNAMVASLVITVLLVCFQRYVVKKTGSLAIKADSLHYMTDIFGNIAVIIALLLSNFWLHADAFLALAAAFFIAHSSWDITKESLNVLMDRELPEDQCRKIMKIIQSDSHHNGFHDLRTRHAGHKIFIQFHLVIAPEVPLDKAHQIGDLLEEKILLEFPSAECLIHLDPKDDNNKNQ